MIRLSALVLAVLVGTTLASPTRLAGDADVDTHTVNKPSWFALFQDDDAETASLDASRLFFHDFCLSARDSVKHNFDKLVNTGAANLFSAVSNGALDIASEAGEAGKVVAGEGVKRIGEDAMQVTSVIKQLFDSIVAGVKEGLASSIGNGVAKLTKDNAIDLYYDGCENLNKKLMPELEQLLAEAKEELLDTITDEASKAVIQGTTLANVGCVTTGRISKLSRSCSNLSGIDRSIIKGL